MSRVPREIVSEPRMPGSNPPAPPPFLHSFSAPIVYGPLPTSNLPPRSGGAPTRYGPIGAGNRRPPGNTHASYSSLPFSTSPVSVSALIRAPLAPTSEVYRASFQETITAPTQECLMRWREMYHNSRLDLSLPRIIEAMEVIARLTPHGFSDWTPDALYQFLEQVAVTDSVIRHQFFRQMSMELGADIMAGLIWRFARKDVNLVVAIICGRNYDSAKRDLTPFEEHNAAAVLKCLRTEDGWPRGIHDNSRIALYVLDDLGLPHDRRGFAAVILALVRDEWAEIEVAGYLRTIMPMDVLATLLDRIAVGLSYTQPQKENLLREVSFDWDGLLRWQSAQTLGVEVPAGRARAHSGASALSSLAGDTSSDGDAYFDAYSHVDEQSLPIVDPDQNDLNNESEPAFFTTPNEPWALPDEAHEDPIPASAPVCPCEPPTRDTVQPLPFEQQKEGRQRIATIHNMETEGLEALLGKPHRRASPHGEFMHTEWSFGFVLNGPTFIITSQRSFAGGNAEQLLRFSECTLWDIYAPREHTYCVLAWLELMTGLVFADLSWHYQVDSEKTFATLPGAPSQEYGREYCYWGEPRSSGSLHPPTLLLRLRAPIKVVAPVAELLEEKESEPTKAVRKRRRAKNKKKSAQEEGEEIFSLFVGDLCTTVNDEQLRNTVNEALGTDDCFRARIIIDHNTGISRGYAFLDFKANIEAATRAIPLMQGKVIGSRAIRCGWARQSVNTDNDTSLSPSSSGAALNTSAGAVNISGSPGARQSPAAARTAAAAAASLGDSLEISADISSLPVVGLGAAATVTVTASTPTAGDTEFGTRPPERRGRGGSTSTTNSNSRGRGTYSARTVSREPSTDSVMTERGADELDFSMSSTTPRSSAREEDSADDAQAHNTTVYVGNVTREVNEAVLRSVFAEFGTVESVNFCEGFAFVRYATHAQAKAAIRSANGTHMYGRKIKCSWGTRKSSSTGSLLGDKTRSSAGDSGVEPAAAGATSRTMLGKAASSPTLMPTPGSTIFGGDPSLRRQQSEGSTPPRTPATSGGNSGGPSRAPIFGPAPGRGR